MTTAPRAQKRPSTIALRFAVIVELVRYLRRRGGILFIPLVLALVLTSFLLVGITLFEYVAPFVYTIF